MLPLPATVNLAYGLAPSLFVKAPEELVPLAEKLYRVVKVCAVTRPAGIKLSPPISPMAKMANSIPLTEQMARRTSGRVDRLEPPGARATPGMKVWNGRRALVPSRWVAGFCLTMFAT